MKTKPVEEVWLSLEQVSQALGLPWVTVWRWAKSGDPRLPAYPTWDNSTPAKVSYRFKKEDLAEFQAKNPAP